MSYIAKQKNIINKTKSKLYSKKFNMFTFWEHIKVNINNKLNILIPVWMCNK